MKVNSDTVAARKTAHSLKTTEHLHGFWLSPTFRLACSLCCGPCLFERAQLLISIPFSVNTLILYQLIEGPFILLKESGMRADAAV